MKKKLSIFFALLTLILCTATITAFAGDSFYNATPVQPNTTYDCYSYGNDQREYFCITPAYSGTYEFYSISDRDTYGYIYDSNMNELYWNDDGGDGSNFYISAYLYAGNTYYMVSRFYSSSASGAYSVRIDTDAIPPENIAAASVTLSKTSYTYSGDAHTPGATVVLNGRTLAEGTDYYITYSNNVKKGTATATINGIGHYAGSVSKTYKITAKKMKSCIIYNASYNGKAQTPAVYRNKKIYDAEYDYYYTDTIKLKKGTDYTISVSGNHKSIGEYKVTIKFKGNYSGTVKKTFKILPAPVKKVTTSTVSTSEIKVKWSKVNNVSGYKIYRYNTKKGKYTLYKTTNQTSCTIKKSDKYDTDVTFYIRTYKTVGKKTYHNDKYSNCWGWDYVKPSKATFSIKKTDFGEFYVNFPASQRYEIQVSTSKSFKSDANNTCKTCRYYTDSVRFYNYRSGQKYYVRARAYYYDKKNNLKVGAWSDVKTVTPY